MRFGRVKVYGVTFGILFVLLNASAYRHAYLMTHYSDARTGTRAPQELSMWERASVLLTGVTVPRPVNKVVPVGVEYRTVRIEGRLEAWEIAGDGETVVMFPGHASAKSSLLTQAKLFRELGMRCVLVDFRGCGGSDGDVCTVGWDESKDVAAAVTWARQEHPGGRIILYGSSMGAAAILRAMATDDVQADGVILECPFDRFLTTVGHRYHAMRLPAFPFAQLLVFWGGVQHGFNAFAFNPIEYAGKVQVPALVMDGEFDLWVSPAEARSVAAAMRGDTTVQIFQGGGHGAYIQAFLQQYRQTVGEWVRRFRLKTAG